MMKRVAQLVATVVVMATVVVGAAWADTYAYSYDKEGTVIEVNSDKVVVVDSFGDEWAFFGDDYRVGDKVKMSIFGYDTDTIRDDEVRKVKKVH